MNFRFGVDEIQPKSQAADSPMDKRIAHELLRPVPSTKEELLIASLTHAKSVSCLFDEISSEVSRTTDQADPKFNRLRFLLESSRIEASGTVLHIAAQRLGLTHAA